MNASDENRIAAWGAIGAFACFSLALLILTMLQDIFGTAIAPEVYRKIIGIPTFSGLIAGFAGGLICQIKFSRMKKFLPEQEMKKICHKEITCLSVITLTAIVLFVMTCCIHVFENT